MARSTKEILDDDGNVIEPPPAGSPVAQIVWLLEYARLREFHIPLVQVGDTIVHVNDLRQVKANRPQTQTPELDPDSDMAKILMHRRDGEG